MDRALLWMTPGMTGPSILHDRYAFVRQGVEQEPVKVQPTTTEGPWSMLRGDNWDLTWPAESVTIQTQDSPHRELWARLSLLMWMHAPRHDWSIYSCRGVHNGFWMG